MPNPSPISVEEHQVGGTTWIALRARNMIWIWLTPDEDSRDRQGLDREILKMIILAERVIVIAAAAAYFAGAVRFLYKGSR